MTVYTHEEFMETITQKNKPKKEEVKEKPIELKTKKEKKK